MRVKADLTRRTALATAAASALAATPAVAERLTAGGAYLTVNGDRQWLLRSGPADAPVLLLLHGGPGASETLLFRRFNRALETTHQLAYWDQRGAGLSYDPAKPPVGMTVAQFVRDLDVVVDHLRTLTNRPVILLGHSWGSALGALYAHAHPGKIAGFIGVGQVADQAEQERLGYAWAFDEARRRSERKAVAELEGIAAPPFDVPELMVKNRWVEAFGGYFAPGFPKVRTLMGALASGQTSVGEVKRVIDANTFSLRALWPEVRSLDVPAAAPAFEVPVAFLLGRHDRQVPPEPAAAWHARLTAPRKRLVWFERSAHNPPFEQPAAFNVAVTEIVADWLRR